MGVQPHPWRHTVLPPHRQDYCTARIGRADIEVASRGVDVGSCPRRLCYPWGNFSVTTRSHQETQNGSLDQAFAPGFVAFRNPVRLAFALALYTRFLTSLSQPLGILDRFSRTCRPSQTAHLYVSRPKSVSDKTMKSQYFKGVSTPPEEGASVTPDYPTYPRPYHKHKLQ